MNPDPSKYEKRKTWDILLRSWHWLFAILVCTTWILGEFMSFSNIKWHFYLGYAVLGFISARVIWGLVGPKSARFSSLPLAPASIVAGVKTLFSREPGGHAGHSSLGALSIIAMLLAIGAQAATGLFIESEDFFEYGPLAGYVSDETVRLMSTWHHRIAKLVLVLVGLHIAAVLFYLVWKRENLITAMITGLKWVKRDQAE